MKTIVLVVIVIFLYFQTPNILSYIKRHLEVKSTPKSFKRSLDSYGIKTRDQWRKWIIKNHPDKRIHDKKATSIFQEVHSMGKALNW